MKKAKKNIILLIAAAAVLIAAVFGLNIQSVDEYYSGGADGSSSEIQSRTVTLEIRCDTVLKNYEELDNRLKSDEYVPPDGVILPVTEYELIEGDTVFSVLKRAVREKKIQMEYQGADGNGYKTVYVQGIHHLYEFSCRTAVRLDVPRQRRISEQRLLGLRIEGRRRHRMGLHLRSRAGYRAA